MNVRICSGCERELEVSSDNFYRNKNNKSGFSTSCKECQDSKSKKWYSKNKERALANKRRYNRRNKESRQNGRLKRKYGIEMDEYLDMLEKQDGKCAICGGTDDVSLAVDHNHRNGQVRGLLCGPCNRGIGLLQDSPDVVRKALEYLESWE